MLLTPGPTPVPEFVRKAMADVTIHHRTPEFEKIFEETRKLLLEVYGMPEVVMLASSGTGAMEACVTNLTVKKALTVNSGKFGERFGKICDSHGIEKIEIKNEWNTPVSVESVVEAVKNDSDIDAIFIQVCESAGGLRHPVEEIAAEIKKINPDIMMVADGITAIGVEKIDTTNLDAVITGSQKALMLPPGLAMIGLSNKAVEKIELNAKGYYFNLATEIKKQRTNTTAWTAATTLIIGLREILSYIKNNGGFEALYEKTAKRAEATREAFKAIGCEIFPKTPANAMTTIYTEDAPAIRQILKTKYNTNIAGGQDHVKKLIFRINHMGLVEDFEASWAVNAVELAMDELGLRKYDGTANKVFAQKNVFRLDMIFEHEIPKGSRLYFGKAAKAKRDLENRISTILDKRGFEEIVTPNFSYSQHQAIANDRKLIKFSDEKNEQVSLRADSTLDVVRIITKRLGRTTSHKKWFYVQPIFTYPSSEDYQIGCEWIDHTKICDILNLTGEILVELGINPILQLSNINIPKIVASELDIDVELFKNGEIAKLLEMNIPWLEELIKVKDIEDLEKVINEVPLIVKVELEKLLTSAKEVEYKNLVIAPLYHGSLKYYDDVYYRVIQDNFTLCKGGHYSSDGISSLGFAFYTDSLLKILED